MTSQPGLQTIAVHILPNTHKVKATREKQFKVKRNTRKRCEKYFQS